jgi:tetratricopeptide (TPR) repeat protein
VFAGGAERAAIVAVCAPEGEEGASLDAQLEALVAKSLLRREAPAAEPGRYSLLEIIREFAREQLAHSGEEAAVHERHLVYFLAVAEQAEPQLWGPQQHSWLDRFDTDRDNFRAALAWAVQGGTAEPGLHLAAVLWRFWELRGYWSEGREHLAALLAAAPASTPGRAAALAADGLLAWRLGDYAAAQAVLEESLALARTQRDHAVLAGAHYGLGVIATTRNAYEAAQEHLTASLALYRALGDQAHTATALHALGLLAAWQGEVEQDRAWTEEALALRQGLGDTAGIIVSQNNLGDYWRLLGDYAQARRLYAVNLALAQTQGNKLALAWSLVGLGMLTQAEGDLAGAQGYHAEALALYRELGNRMGQLDMLGELMHTVLLRGDGAGAFAYAKARLALAGELGSPARISSSRLRLALAHAWAGEYA